MRRTPTAATSASPTPEAPPAAGRLRRLWLDTGPIASLTVSAIVAASLLACVYLHRVADATDADRHRLLHRELSDELAARVERYRSGLMGVAGLFASDGAVGSGEFRRAVLATAPRAEYPAMERIGVGRLAAAADDPGAAPAASRFRVHPLPAGSGAESVESLALGGVGGIEPFTLVHRAGQRPRLLASLRLRLQPRTQPGLDGGSGGAATVWAELDPDVLLAGALDRPGAELATLVVASVGGTPGLVVARSGGGLHGAEKEAISSPLSVGSERWTLTTAPTPAFQRASLLGAWLVKVAGLTTSGLALLLFRVPAIHRRRARREAKRMAVEMTAELRVAAETDRLTGLLNRATVLQEIATTIEAEASLPARHHALLFVDFDHFKAINDTRGHAAGDELLRRISGRILAELRAGDTAGRGRRPFRGAQAEATRRGDRIPARLGGDEFVVLLRNLRDPEDALRVADRMLSRLSRPYFLHDDGTPVISTPSIGVALGGPCFGDAAALVAAADEAMYEAKRDGRACVRVFRAEPPEEAAGEPLPFSEAA